MWDWLSDVWSGDSALGEGLGILDGEGWGDGGDLVDLGWFEDTLVGDALGSISELMDDSWVLENSSYLGVLFPGAMFALTAFDMVLDAAGLDEGSINDDLSDALGGLYDQAVFTLAGAELGGWGEAAIDGASDSISSDGVDSSIWGNLFDSLTDEYLSGTSIETETYTAETTGWLDSLLSSSSMEMETSSMPLNDLFGSTETTTDTGSSDLLGLLALLNL